MEEYSEERALQRPSRPIRSFADITSTDFGVLEGPTSVTRGLAAVHT